MLFDSLNRLALGAYGGTAVETPNFDRFSKQSVTFDKHYVGSLPCMPARRDMHTGRLNFMHRPWGPLEPFDNSYAQLLSKHGVYSHLVSDHLHYFETGGWGYANAFDSWDFIRGQEYDPINVMTRPPIARFREQFDERQYPMGEFTKNKTITRGNTTVDAWRRSRHAINMEFMKTEDDFPTAKCFSRAFEFLNLNMESDDWFLQLECFDPHEPFTAPKRFNDAYKTGYEGKILDWPIYEKVSGSSAEIAQIRANYAALVAMCDEYFGKLLDWMDMAQAWDNTAIILTTDHGFLLGEHEWWGKNKMPYYDEIAHIPLMIWHPDNAGRSGSRVDAVTQTTDLMPTILDFHDVEPPTEITSVSMCNALAGQEGTRKAAMLGMFAGPVCITDGQYTYFQFPENLDAPAPPMYTVMPSHLDTLFSIDELKTSQLVEPFDFTKGAPVLCMQTSLDVGETGLNCVKNWSNGSVLFDLTTDPKQENPITQDDVKDRLVQLIAEEMANHDAPTATFSHYGLTTPNNGENQ